MLKILQINTTANSGSTGRIAEDIGIKVIENGDESYLAYGTSALPCRSKLIKIGGRFDIFYHELLSHFLDNSGLLSKRATKRLIKEIDIIEPDIIHLHNIHGFYLNMKLLFNYLSKLNKPVVWTLHDCWAFTGHCAHFSYINCTKWQKECHNCPNKREYPTSWLMDRSRRNFSLKKRLFNSIKKLNIVTVSNWLNEELSNSFLKGVPSQVISNGVDLEKFYPREKEDAIYEKYGINRNDKILIAAATNWGKRKGISDYNRLSDSLPKGYKIVLVGVPKKRQKLVSGNITIIERTENIDELAKLYSISDVVLNLSYEESFGLTTVEGMACGTPCVLYRATASPELITEGCGTIIDAGNIKGVKEAVVSIIEKGELYYRDNCIERVRNLYDKNKIYDNYLELYKNITNKN